MAVDPQQFSIDVRHLERTATAGLALAFAVWIVIVATGVALLA
jgi:hypothetical protein